MFTILIAKIHLVKKGGATMVGMLIGILGGMAYYGLWGASHAESAMITFLIAIWWELRMKRE